MNISRDTRAYRPRAIEDRWRAASAEFPVLLLTGPRQVGKTTLLEHLSEPARTRVTLDDLALRALARQDPALFLARFPPPLLIDEIQYAPELLTAIKQRVDRERRPGAFWLTGSQQFHMMKGVTETLAGRVGIVSLLGFSMRERDGRTLALPPFLPIPAAVEPRRSSAGPPGLRPLYRRIWEGSFPALATGKVREWGLFYRSYLQTYLERDVRDLTNVGSLESFRRFVRACAARTAQMLNFSDLARDCGISVNTARAWLSVLQASFQVYLLPAYHSNLSKRLYKTPKLYFLDTGLCAYLTEWSSPETLEAGAMSGAILETFVVAEILKSWWHRLEEPAIYYYRDKEGHEVDVLLSQDGRLYPVEIKKSAQPTSESIANFRALEKTKPPLGPGGLLCLYRDTLPLDARNMAIPIGLL